MLICIFHFILVFFLEMEEWLGGVSKTADLVLWQGDLPAEAALSLSVNLHWSATSAFSKECSSPLNSSTLQMTWIFISR